MHPTLCDSLTDRERECLRLIEPGFEEKRVADHLGISHHTVKVHLRAARGKLRVATSVEAAQLLAAHEGRSFLCGSTTLGSIPCHVLTPQEIDLRSRSLVSSVREDHGVVFEAGYPAPEEPTSQRGRPRNGLTFLQRLTAVIALIVFLVFAIAAAPALYRSFQEVANSISPPKR